MMTATMRMYMCKRVAEACRASIFSVLKYLKKYLIETWRERHCAVSAF